MFKKILYIGLASLCLMGCDVIPENERIVSVDAKVGQRRVLLEEFTGFRCVNCPTAAGIAHELIENYGDHVVVMALHPKGSSWTKPAEGYIDLTSEIATVYFEAYGSPNAFPIGMVNRTAYNGSVLQDRATWMTSVNEQLVVDPAIDLSVTATVDSLSRVVTVESVLTSKQEYAGNVNLQLLLTESGIIGFQKMPDGSSNEEYVHNHVLREAINGNWGENVVKPAVDDSVTMTNSYTVPEKYVLKNCSVIAFLYKEDSKEVIQAYEVKL